MENRVAIMDLGTNTFHLLICDIVEDTFIEIIKIKKNVKLGEAGISKGYISSEAEKRALEAMHYFSEIINEYSPSKIKAIGTSAFRNAKNGSDLVNLIYLQTSIWVEIIDGNKEAEIIYNGVKLALTLSSSPQLLMDIGGGSVEFIIATNDAILWKKSYEIGSQRLVDTFHKTDPITIEEENKLYDFFCSTLDELVLKCNEYAVSTLIGVSGAFDTFIEIEYKSKLDLINPKQTEFLLTIQNFLTSFTLIKKSTKDERMVIIGIPSMRADMIVVASCLINFIIFTLKLNQIRISSYSLKEGLIFNF